MKKYFIGIVVGLVVGLWFGVNIAHDRPLWSNPFTDAGLANKAKGVASDAWKGAKKAASDSLAE